MSYQPWLEEQALRQMAGLPGDAHLDTLVQTMARICAGPCDRLLRVAVSDDNPCRADGRARRRRIHRV